VEVFEAETCQAPTYEKGQLKLQVLVDWPISACFKDAKGYKKFFEWAKDMNNYRPHIKDVSFQHLHCNPIRYQIKLYDERMKSCSVVSEEEQEFLPCYRWLRQWPEFFKPKELFSTMEDNQAKEQAETVLQRFDTENEKIRCTGASALQSLIPCVKQLLQLFPWEKENTKHALSSDEVRNGVCLFETRRYIERISQSPLEFNSDASSFREFLESEEKFFASTDG
jgi:hypothetical protein